MGAITCCIRYYISPGKHGEFEHYARVWQRIIERLGGIYYGCFVPGEEPPDAEHFTFPEIGRSAPENSATVIFGFHDLAAYERYRRDAGKDPEFEAVTKHFNESKCFTSYERSFVNRVGS